MKKKTQITEEERKDGRRKGRRDEREEYRMQGSQHKELSLEELYSNKMKKVLTQTFYYARIILVKIKA